MMRNRAGRPVVLELGLGLPSYAGDDRPSGREEFFTAMQGVCPDCRARKCSVSWAGEVVAHHNPTGPFVRKKS